jgi:peroxiredoxin
LQEELKDLGEKKIRLVGLSYDPVEVLGRFANDSKITFPLLSDPESRTIRRFGLLNQEAEGRTEGIPYPGIMILDREGTIRSKLFHDGYRDRHTAADVLEAVKELD